jgi:hypothetical protein
VVGITLIVYLQHPDLNVVTDMTATEHHVGAGLATIGLPATPLFVSPLLVLA